MVAVFVTALSMAVPVFAKDGTDAKGRKQTIIDWDGKLEGEDAVPDWLKTMRRGNALDYCQEYGLNSKINRKWLVPAAATSYIGWEDGLIAARANVAEALAQAIATDINASLASSLDDGAKSNVKSAVLSSITTVSGLEYEGCYWHLVEQENARGKKERIYYVYAFYSMETQKYSDQLVNALMGIYKKGGILSDKEIKLAATQSTAAAVQKSITDEDHDKAVQEEMQRSLNAHRQSMSERSMTLKENAQSNQYNLDMEGVYTDRQRIDATTQQLESRNRATVDVANAQANAATTNSVANATSPAVSSNSGGEMSDTLAFLLSL